MSPNEIKSLAERVIGNFEKRLVDLSNDLELYSTLGKSEYVIALTSEHGSAWYTPLEGKTFNFGGSVANSPKMDKETAERKAKELEKIVNQDLTVCEVSVAMQEEVEAVTQCIGHLQNSMKAQNIALDV